jgi:hypothetical protein
MNWKRLENWKARNALLNHTEKCLLHLLRNPPDSVPSRLWQRDTKVAAAKLGYDFDGTSGRDLIGITLCQEFARQRTITKP